MTQQLIKIEKLNSLILRELNLIIQKEYYKSGIISEMTIHEVVTSNDCSQSKIYYSVVNQNCNLKSLNEIINKNNKSIRYKLSKKLSIYKTPKLIFIYDKTLDNVTKIQKILNTVNNESK